MTMRRKWMLGGLAAALGLVLLVLVFRPASVRVEVATVGRGSLLVTVEEQGKTRVRDRYTVAAPITGRLLRTDADEGLEVARGDVLATMVPPPEDPRIEATTRAELAVATARMREAEAVLKEAESADVQARREAKRRAELFEQGAISIETQEKHEQAARAARARLETARASLRAAGADVERARSRRLGIDAQAPAGQLREILAPVAGTVLRVHEESDRVVQAGTPLFDIGAGKDLELVIDLLTEEAVQVKTRDEIRITGWGDSRTLIGRVRYVEPQAFTEISALGVEEQRVNVIGDLLEAPASLGSGYRIEAAIVTWSGDDVLTIPTSAIFQRGGSWRTFAVEGSRARLRQVEIGHRSTEWAEVLGGVEEGEAVVLFPSDLVGDGVRVAAEPSSD